MVNPLDKAMAKRIDNIHMLKERDHVTTREACSAVSLEPCLEYYMSLTNYHLRAELDYYKMRKHMIDVIKRAKAKDMYLSVRSVFGIAVTMTLRCSYAKTGKLTGVNDRSIAKIMRKLRIIGKDINRNKEVYPCGNVLGMFTWYCASVKQRSMTGWHNVSELVTAVQNMARLSFIGDIVHKWVAWYVEHDIMEVLVPKKYNYNYCDEINSGRGFRFSNFSAYFRVKELMKLSPNIFDRDKTWWICE